MAFSSLSVRALGKCFSHEEKGPNFWGPLLPILRLTFLESSCNFQKFGINKNDGYFFRLDGSSGPMCTASMQVNQDGPSLPDDDVVRVDKRPKTRVLQAPCAGDDSACVEPQKVWHIIRGDYTVRANCVPGVTTLLDFQSSTKHNCPPSALQKVLLREESVQLKLLKHLVATPWHWFQVLVMMLIHYMRREDFFVDGSKLSIFYSDVKDFQLWILPECFELDLFGSVAQQFPENWKWRKLAVIGIQ